MSIINFTGSDCTGKSTLVSHMRELLDCGSIHFDKPKDMLDAKAQYYCFAETMNKHPENVIIADRLHEGEFIYAPVYRGYKADYMREFEREIIKNHNFLLVYTKAELETILYRAKTRGEDFIKEGDFQTFIDLFNDYMNEQALPYIEVDTTNSKTQDDVIKIKEAYDKLNTIWNLIRNGTCEGAILTPALPRGNINADFMIISQNPAGKGKTDYATTWCEGSLSDFVLNITKEANIHRKSWYTNLVPYPTIDNKVTKNQIEETSHIIRTEIELIKPKKIITLGDVASKDISKKYGKDVEIIQLPHPSYIKRFYSNDKLKLDAYKNSFKL